MKNNIKKTIAAILVKQNSKLIIDEITLPSSLKKGQVLVKMIYSGVCASQLGEIQGIKGKDKSSGVSPLLLFLILSMNL